MKSIFNAFKIFVTGLFLCSIVLIGGKASAAEIDTESDNESVKVTEVKPAVNNETLQILRETVLNTSKSDDRPFHLETFFIMPQVIGNLEFLGAAENDTLKLSGNFGLWTIDDNGNPDGMEMPFYLTQDKQNMVLYVKEDKKWTKETSPVEAADAIDMIATPDPKELEMMLEFVKDVTILQENDTQRTMLIKIDGEKIADMIKLFVESSSANKSENQEIAVIKPFVGYVENGFRTSDFWITWTVDKTNWQTVTASYNLSGLIQGIASSALNDTSQSITNLAEIRKLLENLAYYSEFKGYITFLNPAAKSQLVIPKEALKAKESKIFSDEDKNKKKK